MIKKENIFEALQTKADEKAGYPPNCNEGYVVKDGKCVPVDEPEAKADEKAGYPPNCNDGYVAKDGKCVPIDESEGKWPKKKKKK